MHRFRAMGDPAADDGEKVAGTAVKNQPPVNEGEETDGKVAAESEAVDADCKAEEKLVVEDRELDEEQKAFVRRQVAKSKLCVYGSKGDSVGWQLVSLLE